MSVFLAIFLSLAALTEAPRRLEVTAVETDLIAWKWTDGETARDCRVDAKASIMSCDGESRRFRDEESVIVLRALARRSEDPLWKLGLLHYVVDSMIWWEEGLGEPVNPKVKADAGNVPDAQVR